jgi:hypothetical protein
MAPNRTARRLAGLTAAALCAAVALGGFAAGSSLAGPTVPTCKASALGVWGGPMTGAAGTIASEFAFVNQGSHACSLIGYPKLQMLDSSGQPISTTDRRDAGFFGLKKKLVVIAPGKRAYFAAGYPDFTGAGATKCPTSAKLRFTPPGSSATVTLTGPKAAITPYAGSNLKLGCGLVMMSVVTAKNFI